MSIDFDNDPRLSILHVADILGIDYVPEGIRFTAVCPFCGAPKGHFYLTPKHGNYVNVFSSKKCGVHGNQYELYGHFKHTYDQKIAFKQLMGYSVQSKTLACIRKASEALKIVQHNIAFVSLRNSVYRLLLQSLKLSTDHYNNLVNRGLDKNSISLNGYKTLPFNKTFKFNLCYSIQDKLGISLKGIPGFYTENSNWTFWTPALGGFLIPVVNPLGNIQGCQVRKNVIHKKRYPWFSSSYMENGSQANGFVHVHWNTKHSCKKIVITEGPLKGTISSILSDTTFVAVPGTNTIALLLDTLKQMESTAQKIDEIWIAYDMDRYKNPCVMNAQNKLVNLLLSGGYDNIHVSKWNTKYKGIDDYLLFLSSKMRSKKAV